MKRAIEEVVGNNHNAIRNKQYLGGTLLTELKSFLFNYLGEETITSLMGELINYIETWSWTYNPANSCEWVSQVTASFVKIELKLQLKVLRYGKEKYEDLFRNGTLSVDNKYILTIELNCSNKHNVLYKEFIKTLGVDSVLSLDSEEEFVKAKEVLLSINKFFKSN